MTELEKCYGTDGTYVRVRYKSELGSLHSISEYNSYMQARNRCTNKNDAVYVGYGGRGIEFRFDTFSEWWDALGKRPSPLHSVDRLDNDGHYEKGNIRWASKREQSVNRKFVRAVRLTHPNGDNVIYESAQAAERYSDISVDVIRRLCRGQPTYAQQGYQAHYIPKLKG